MGKALRGLLRILAGAVTLAQTALWICLAIWGADKTAPVQAAVAHALLTLICMAGARGLRASSEDCSGPVMS